MSLINFYIGILEKVLVLVKKHHTPPIGLLSKN